MKNANYTLEKLTHPETAAQFFRSEMDSYVADRFIDSSADRRNEVDELIRMGWGDTAPDKIPSDWRRHRKGRSKRWVK